MKCWGLLSGKLKKKIKMGDWRDLARQGKFAEAESLMLEETAKETGYGYEVLTRAGFYEDWATAPKAARNLKSITMKRCGAFNFSLLGRRAAAKARRGCLM
jgi:hypothetical protein